MFVKKEITTAFLLAGVVSISTERGDKAFVRDMNINAFISAVLYSSCAMGRRVLTWQSLEYLEYTGLFYIQGSEKNIFHGSKSLLPVYNNFTYFVCSFCST
jgi:hypothetical protein